MQSESKANRSVLDYICTILFDNRSVHYFRLFGEHEDVYDLAAIKARDLGGEFLITHTVNTDRTVVSIKCSNNDWKTKLLDPVITTTIRRLCNAQ